MNRRIAAVGPASPDVVWDRYIHPERWSAGGFDWYLQYGIDLAFNTGKKVIRWMR